MTTPATSPEADDLLDEQTLLAELRAGDEAAYETLIRTFGGRMLAAARRILPSEEDAQDAVQEAFLSAFRKIETFQGQSKLGTWLHRIAINASLMKLRSLRRRKEQDVDELLPRFTPGGASSSLRPGGGRRPTRRSSVTSCGRRFVRPSKDFPKTIVSRCFSGTSKSSTTRPWHRSWG